jgi:uncharacterized membrane protein
MLRFVNNYPSTVWAMVEWHHPDCPDGGNWEKAGWWMMRPGESKVVFGGSASFNQFWYFFAHAEDGALWTGPFQEIVPPRAFQWCENVGDTASRTIGMRELDVGSVNDYTLTLTPG